MTISNPVPPAGRQEGSTSTGTAQTPNRTGSLTRSNNNSSSSSDSIVLQAHRQSHNSSKLPAYRFADLKSSAISLPSLPRHTSAASEDKTKPRPPTSYKPPNTAHTSGSRATIPPIRSFRSSGSRKSLALDMHGRRVSGDSLSEGPTDPDPRDRALRALEGRRDDDFSHLAPPDSGDMTTTTDNDNTADLFMRIAGEDKSRLALEEQGPTAEPSTISRVIRTTHRRPLSAAIPASDIPSPPQVSRRHSDQRDNARARQVADARPAQQTTKELASRTTARENLPSIATAAEGLSRAHQPRTPLRPSPITPRQLSFNDSFSETGSAYQFRRRSITENNNGSSTKTTPYRAANLTTNRIYHSSPLVPKSPNVQKDDPQHASDPNHGVEGTESSTSTVAPSTVWDELDELKSRIHRLELTGKMMSTSRTSDGRPRTATTATTMSASPKQGSGKSPNQADGNGNKSQPREARPLLQSALGRAKDLVSSDVFNAIELAANEALALSSMMGAPGQPGPISSAASAVGYGSVVGVTDRQLRRKADSICRSLTELCIALAGEASRARNDQPTAAADEKELLLSPTSIVPLATSTQRRPSAPAETMAKSSSSPRSFSALEQKRQVMLAAAPLTPSVLTTAPNRLREPVSAVRSSSLLLNRVRRAGAEEGEEGPVRRSSLLLRARRAGSEEPQENREVRKTSLLLRARRTVDQEEDEYRFRAPSRAVTEVNGPRTAARDLGYAAQPPPSEVSGPTSSAPTRRRFLPSSLTSRLVTTSIPPATPSATPSATPARRYFRVSPQEYGPVDDAAQMAVVEDRAPQKQQQQRQLALSQTTPMLHRSDSLGRRSRENGSIPTSLTPSWQQAQSGGGRYQ